MKKIICVLLSLIMALSVSFVLSVSVGASSAISVTHNASTLQTITYSIDSGTTTYYWGSNSDYAKNPSTNPSSSTTSVKKTVTEPGSYYMTSYKETRNASGTLVGSVTSTYNTVSFYKVSLEANGGSVGINYVLASDYDGEYTALPTPNPTRTGYRFIGWSTSSNATSGVTSVCPHSNLTYYAIWEKVSNATGKTVVLDVSQIDSGDANWFAWTWSEGNNGYWVRGYGNSETITFESLEKNVVFAALNPLKCDNGDTPNWNANLAQTYDLTVDGNTFTVTGYEEGGIILGGVRGIWSENSSNTNPTETAKPDTQPTTVKSTTPPPTSPQPSTETSEKKTQTITAKSYTKTYGSKAFSLNANTSGNGKLTYKISDKKVATVSSKGKVTIKGCGKATITITASKTAKYKSASKKITITVKPAKLKLKTFKGNKKSLKIYYTKQNNADGYQCIYNQGSKKITTTSKKNYVTLKNLQKGTCIAKIRAYKKMSGVTFYGKYSKYQLTVG